MGTKVNPDKFSNHGEILAQRCETEVDGDACKDRICLKHLGYLVEKKVLHYIIQVKMIEEDR